MLWTLHLISCAFMTGLIWTIQCLHYPAFHWVDGARFKEFHLWHTRKITWIVGPVMLVELVSALGLFWQDRQNLLLQMNLALLVLTWLCTVFLSVPIHQGLESEKSSQKIERLISTNWYRTALWSLRLGLLVWGSSL